MSRPTTLLHSPQIPKTLTPFFPFSIPHSPTRRFFSIQILQFSKTLPSIRRSSLSESSVQSSFQHQYQFQQQQQEDDNEYDDEDHVIGDCVVFEEGIFEDPYLQQEFNSNKERQHKSKKFVAAQVKPQDLVPDNWKGVLAEINMTKKERRIIAHELELNARVDKKKRLSMPVRGVNVEEFLTYREAKLAQLKPLVLDNPGFTVEEGKNVEEDGGGESREAEENRASSSRVAPRNPRWAVYGGTLEDISEFFNSPDYEPGRGSSTEGRGRLFTKEEKVLLNKRKPDLAAATSGKWLPLHTLAASGEFNLMNALLKHNVDINGADKDGLTALQRAIISKKQAITNYLLRESANPFVCDNDGASLMHYAVQAASVPAIKVLLLYNVDINFQDNDGWTPLHVAVQARRTDTVKLLLIKGANKTLKNKDGLTPLDLCLYSGQNTTTYELIKVLKQLPKPVRNLDGNPNPAMLQLPKCADSNRKLG